MDESRANALKGKRIVVTRASAQSEPLAQALQEKGAVPVLVPLVAFGPPDDVAALDEAIRQLGQYEWMFVTSQNALRALQERSQFLQLNLAQALKRVRVAAVGPATGEVLENAGVKVAYVAGKHLGVALAEELAEEVNGKKVLLPRSDKANPELVKRLVELGAQVQEVVAYKMIRPDAKDVAKVEAMAREGVDAVLFFSPSAVHHLQEMLGTEKFLELSRTAVFAAIGPVTEEALRRLKVERVVLAGDTTLAGVLAALTDFFSQLETNSPAGA